MCVANIRTGILGARAWHSGESVTAGRTYEDLVPNVFTISRLCNNSVQHIQTASMLCGQSLSAQARYDIF